MDRFLCRLFFKTLVFQAFVVFFQRELKASHKSGFCFLNIHNPDLLSESYCNRIFLSDQNLQVKKPKKPKSKTTTKNPQNKKQNKQTKSHTKTNLPQQNKNMNHNNQTKKKPTPQQTLTKPTQKIIVSWSVTLKCLTWNLLISVSTRQKPFCSQKPSPYAPA